MAPTLSPHGWSPGGVASGGHLRTVLSRTVSTSLAARETTGTTPIASVFALIIRGTVHLSKRWAARSARSVVEPVFLDHSSSTNLLARQSNAVLAIPTTYAGLNSGPAPGAVVGIVLGSIGGFILILYIFLSAFRLWGGGGRGGEVVEEQVIHHRRRRSRSRSRAMTERSIPLPRPSGERVVREREETVVVEEHVDPTEDDEDDIVEVIEEHSPERRPKRGPSGRSGFRTVDPAEFGGGSRPIRKVSRR